MPLSFIEKHQLLTNPSTLCTIVRRRWYISIIPHGSNPGTTNDVDFYAAAPNVDDGFDDSLPPMANWISCVQNAGSAPTGVYPYAYEDSDGGHSLSSNSLSVPSLAEPEEDEEAAAQKMILYV